MLRSVIQRSIVSGRTRGEKAEDACVASLARARQHASGRLSPLLAGWWLYSCSALAISTYRPGLPFFGSTAGRLRSLMKSIALA